MGVSPPLLLELLPELELILSSGLDTSPGELLLLLGLVPTDEGCCCSSCWWGGIEAAAAALKLATADILAWCRNCCC